MTVPPTVTSAGRTPRVAPVAITRVTIGPGVITSTKVMRRKVAKSSRFSMAGPALQRFDHVTPPRGLAIVQRLYSKEMTMSDVAARRSEPMTVEAFLEFCDTLPDGERWELIDGAPMMMTG